MQEVQYLFSLNLIKVHAKIKMFHAIFNYIFMSLRSHLFEIQILQLPEFRAHGTSNNKHCLVFANNGNGLALFLLTIKILSLSVRVVCREIERPS